MLILLKYLVDFVRHALLKSANIVIGSLQTYESSSVSLYLIFQQNLGLLLIKPLQARVYATSPILETPEEQLKHGAAPPYMSRLRPPLPRGRNIPEVASTSKRAFETPDDAPAGIFESVPPKWPSSDSVLIADKRPTDASVAASQSPPKPKALNFDDFVVEAPRVERPERRIYNIIPSGKEPQPQRPDPNSSRGHRDTPTRTSCHEASPVIPLTPLDMPASSESPSTGERFTRRKFKRLRKARDLVRFTQQEEAVSERNQSGGSKQPEDGRIATKKDTRLGIYRYIF